MVTLCCCSRGSRLSFAKVGRWVWNLVELVPEESFTGFLVLPVMDSPVLVMLVTLPAFTWSRNVLYEMVTVDGCPAEKRKLLIRMLTPKRMASVIQKRQLRIGVSMSGLF